MKRNLGICLLFVLISCAERDNYIPESKQEIPPSYISFRIKFPISEVQQGVNSIIPSIVMDNDIPMDDGGVLHLKIVKAGNLSLAIRNTTIYGTLPLKVYIGLTKKVLGMNITNKDSPIAFAGNIKLSSEVSLNDAWNLELECNWLGIDWVENPEISLLGMTFDLKDVVVKALEENEEMLIAAICNAIQTSINLGENIEKIWGQMQQPIRIAKDPLKMWLYFRPEVLNGELVAYERDTLAVHLEFRTGINISTNPPFDVALTPLPTREDPMSTKSIMIAHAKMQLPMHLVRERIIHETQGQELEYRGYKTTITGVEVMGEGNRIEVLFQVEGDIDGQLIASGIPFITEDLSLMLRNFKYRIKTENTWVNITDVLFHPFIADYIAEQVQINVKSLLDQLDSLAMDGIKKIELGQKIDPHFQFDRFSSNQLYIENDTLSWFIDVEGYVELQLKRGLFQKNQ